MPVMQGAGFSVDAIVMKRALEMRYIGQEFSLLIDCPREALAAPVMQQIRARFNTVYEARYGHAFPDLLPEVASLRLHVYGVLEKPQLNLRGTASVATSAQPRERRRVYFDETGFVDCAVFRRPELKINTVLQGPAVIEEHSSTTIVSPLDSVIADAFGNLIITVHADST